jgi:hypothetical protein
MKKSSIICCLAMVSLYVFLFIYACGGNGDGSVAGSGNNSIPGSNSGDNSSPGGDSGDILSSDDGTSEFATDTGAKLLIEHNATEEYTGFQGFTDGQLWYELAISDPQGQRVMMVTTEGGLGAQGLTEFFFKTSETKSTEVPIENVLANLPEGDYAFEFDSGFGDYGDPGYGYWDYSFWDYGYEDPYSAKVTHIIPTGAVVLSPNDGSTVDPDNLVVSWESVNEDINGAAVNIVGYQVNVEKDEAPEFPQSFAQSLFSVNVPATVTSMTVPREFLESNACYKYNVLAIEESGNQTVSSAEFDTGPGCVRSVEQEPGTPLLIEAKLLIEHNATEDYTGFKGCTNNGEIWYEFAISDPQGQWIMTVTPEGGLGKLGLSELFFKTSEILNAEVPIEDVLANLPEGNYAFAFRSGYWDYGYDSPYSVKFTHTIPAGPVLLTPADGSTEDASNLVVSWESVNEDINGAAVNIVGYQVKLAKYGESQFPQSFARSLFSVYLPATVTSVTVPKEFMEGGAIYKYQVLAIEESGNQTISSAMFGTQ